MVDFIRDSITDSTASDGIVLPANILAYHFAMMACQKQRNYYFMRYVIYNTALNLWNNIKPEFLLAFRSFNTLERNNFIDNTKAEFREWFFKTRKNNHKEFYCLIYTAMDIPLLMKMNKEAPNEIVALFLTCPPLEKH